jgi:hypothetical protein
MKQIIAVISLYFLFLTSAQAAFTSSPSGNETSETFEESQIGASLTIAKELKIIDNIFTDNGSDYVFSDIGIFGNYYGDVINHNYGASISMGYNYSKVALFMNAGYLVTDFDYIVSDESEGYSKGASFFGVGASYKITNYLKAKLDVMSYTLSFTPSNSAQIETVDLDVVATNIGLQFYF